MRFLKTGIATVVLMLGPPAVADGPKLAADDVLTTEAQRLRATVDGDWAQLDRLLADDLTYCHSSGVCETKAQYLGALRAGGMRYRRIDVLESRVRRHGDLAIVNGRVRVDATQGTTVLDGMQLAYTDIYRRERGRWRLIAWHSSRIP
jgi:ketosteroid isomerase-like protein